MKRSPLRLCGQQQCRGKRTIPPAGSWSSLGDYQLQLPVTFLAFASTFDCFLFHGKLTCHIMKSCANWYHNSMVLACFAGWKMKIEFKIIFKMNIISKSPSCRKRIRQIRSSTQLDSINFLDSLFHSPLSSKLYFPRIEGSSVLTFNSMWLLSLSSLLSHSCYAPLRRPYENWAKMACQQKPRFTITDLFIPALFFQTAVSRKRNKIF